MASRRSTRNRHSDGRTTDAESDVPALEDDDVHDQIEDDLDDGVEEVTRCICGNPELQLSPASPEYDSVDTGFFIQCEDCQVWQHGYCVGIKDEADAPDKYWCELCKPELHTLVYKGPKEKRSVYTPAVEKKRSAGGAARGNGKRIKEEREEPADAHSSSSSAKPSASPSSAIAATVALAKTTPESRHRRERSRGTLNSRDAEYEMMLKKALEESAKESGVQPEDPELSEFTRERSSRRRTRAADDVKHEDDLEGFRDDDTDAEQRHMTRPRGEHSERGERASQSATRQHPDAKRRRTDQEHGAPEAAADTSGHEHGTTDDAPVGHAPAETPKRAMSPPASAPQSAAVARAVGTDDNSENDSSVPKSVAAAAAAAAAKKRRPRRAATSKSKADEPRTTPKKNARSQEEIDADKPTKPRLPQARVSMYEMRRRTSAILEFLVRTQTELKDEFEHGVDITDFIDANSEVAKEEIRDALSKGHLESIGLMEDLTRKIIDWNTKYGESAV